MNCEIIFYLARKTSFCEKMLKKLIEGLNLNTNKSFFAVSPKTLGKHIINSFERSNVVFVVGGLGEHGKTGIENVLSKALAGRQPDEIKKLKNTMSTEDGYVIRQGSQLMIVLPDEPEEIKSIFAGPLKGYLEKFIER